MDSNKSNWSDLLPRTISAICLASVAIICAIFGGIPFMAFAAVLGILSAYEWIALTKNETNQRAIFLIVGLIFILGAAYSMAFIRLGYSDGFEIIVWMSLAVISADVGGYFAGKTFGGPKLLPRVSPKKTWSGLLGGIFLAAIMSIIISHLLGWGNPIKLAFFGTIITVVALCGDLIESACKRRFG